MSYKNESYRKFLAATVSTVAVASTVVPIAPYYAQAEGKAASFSDVSSGDHFYAAVSSLSERNVIEGYKEGAFKPYENVTRAQAAKMIALALNLDTSDVNDPGFKDVSSSHWAYSYVAALVNHGIIQGYGDAFKPNDPLSRAQLAKMITLAYKLEPSPLTDQRFTDVRPIDWYASYVQPLIEKGITTGTSAAEFSPHKFVSRGQMASFIYRSELAMKSVQVQSVITNITNLEMITKQGSYKLSPDLKEWMNPSNLSALKGAIVTFQVKNGLIEKIQSVELTSSGTASAESDKYANHLVFNGNETVIDADVIVSGDYTILKNVTIKGNLQLGQGVENSFYSDNIKIAGKTIVSGDAQTAAFQADKFYKSLAYKSYASRLEIAAADETARQAHVVFNNSSLGTVEINKANAVIETTGNTKAGAVTIGSKAKFRADASVVIPKITIEAGVESVEIDSKVEEVTIIGNGSIVITGSGDFGHMTASAASIVTVQTTGKVGTLETTDKDSRFILGKNTKVNDVKLPEGVKPETSIDNYSDVKKNIEKIGGEKNTASSSSGGSSSGGGSSSLRTAPSLLVDHSEAELGHDIELTFTDNAAWRASVTSVEVDGTTLMAGTFTLAEGKLTIDKSIFTSAKDYTVVVRAARYYSAEALQTVAAPNHMPVVVNEVADQIVTAGDAPFPIDLSSVFTDVDNDVLTLTASSSTASVATVSVTGTTMTITPVNAGTSTITVTANDGKGGIKEETFTVNVAQLNHVPVVINGMNDQFTTVGAAPFPIDLSNVFADADNDQLTLTAVSANPGVAMVNVTGTTMMIMPLNGGTSTITVTANDDKGGIKEETFTVNVAQLNHVPVVVHGINDQSATAGAAPLALDLSSVFADADNDPLMLTAVSTNPGVATVSVAGTTLTVTPIHAGTTTITVTANDGKGGTISSSFTVTIEEALAAAPNLFVSETIWGTYDLAFEVYNPTGETVDLSQLKLVLPDKEISFETFGLTLAPGEILAIIDTFFFLNNDEIPSKATRVPFDLDPATPVESLKVELVYGNQVIDTINYQKDKTMIRNSGVAKGSSTYEAAEWTEYPLDDIDHIGSHTP